MRGFGHFLIPSFMVSSKNTWEHDPFFILNTKKNGLQIMSLSAYASGTNYGI